jgi:hypothetical protein
MRNERFRISQGKNKAKEGREKYSAPADRKESLRKDQSGRVFSRVPGKCA